MQPKVHHVPAHTYSTIQRIKYHIWFEDDTDVYDVNV